MQDPFLREQVGALVAKNPNFARVFETYNIDYCCKGQQTLLETCQAKRVDADAVISALHAEAQKPITERDWSHASACEVIDHIEKTYHIHLKQELPRLASLIDKVVKAHGKSHPELLEVQTTFAELHKDLLTHLEVEEVEVFPKIKSMETSSSPSSLDQPIASLINDHEHVEKYLERLSSLTNGYAVPQDACNSFLVMLTSLKELEGNLHRHVHMENSILFPKVQALQAR
ncbi:MAG: Iron-sulfur cluster repair protein YtfE [Chlamydiae bacterium]|nr:Iron-sulfur cluster repair protein YtfE [Chlamydiota bacterium]